MTAVATLALSGVTVSYPGHTNVLDELDLTIPEGSRLAVVGANGSGKTTLLRTLSGAVQPVRGTVMSAGEPLRYRRHSLDDHRRRVQLVLQDPDDQLFSADVYADVSFGPTNLGLSAPEVRSRVETTLELLDIAQLAERPVHELSYGQRKRVAIAGAVAMSPRVLMLDEPTAGLDPGGVESMLSCLAGLERAGTTVVLSTHDLALVWEWADEVAVLAQGRLRRGRPDEILSDARILAQASLRPPWQAQLLARVGGIGAEPRARTLDEVAARLGLS